MRKAVVLPTIPMIGIFGLGTLLIIIWGISGAVYGANAFSEFFASFAVLIQFPVLAIVLIALLLIALVKLFYYVVSFFAGVLVGLFILMFLGSSISNGLLATSLLPVTRGVKDLILSRPRPPTKSWRMRN